MAAVNPDCPDIQVRLVAAQISELTKTLTTLTTPNPDE